MGFIGLTAVRQATATIKLMQVSTGMKSATMSGLIKFNCPFGSKVQNICCSSTAHEKFISQMTVDSSIIKDLEFGKFRAYLAHIVQPELRSHLIIIK